MDLEEFDPEILDHALPTPRQTTRRSNALSSAREELALPLSVTSSLSSALPPTVLERLNAMVRRELDPDGELSAEGLAIVAAIAGGHSMPSTIPVISAPTTSFRRMSPGRFEDSMKYDGDPKKLPSSLSSSER